MIHSCFCEGCRNLLCLIQMTTEVESYHIIYLDIIYPFKIHSYLFLLKVTLICWSLSLLSLGKRSPVHHRAHIQTTTHALTHLYGCFRITNQPDIHISGMWKEARVPTGKRKTQKNGDNIQTPHKKTSARFQTSKISVNYQALWHIK